MDNGSGEGMMPACEIDTDPVADFRRAVEAAGLIPGDVIPDGVLRRCPTEKHPNRKDVAYKPFMDGLTINSTYTLSFIKFFWKIDRFECAIVFCDRWPIAPWGTVHDFRGKDARH